MNDSGEKDEGAGGYGKPPVLSRFKKGQSGNPKGRPRGRHREPPYQAVLGQKVKIREDGREKHVTAAEAFLLQVTKSGLEGDGSAGRQAMAAIEEARARRLVRNDEKPPTIVWSVTAPGTVYTALEPLRMGKKLDRYRDTARMLLEPWIVEAALARLGARKLSTADQEEVLKATRTPHKVRWPDWWAAKP